nr:MAG TPA: hypothetical protein [Caudoviricetes sp.]
MSDREFKLKFAEITLWHARKEMTEAKEHFRNVEKLIEDAEKYICDAKEM